MQVFSWSSDWFIGLSVCTCCAWLPGYYFGFALVLRQFMKAALCPPHTLLIFTTFTQLTLHKKHCLFILKSLVERVSVKAATRSTHKHKKKTSPVSKLFWSAIRNQAAGRRMQNAKRSALVPQAQAHRARIRRDASERGSAPENIVSLYIGK